MANIPKIPLYDNLLAKKSQSGVPKVSPEQISAILRGLNKEQCEQLTVIMIHFYHRTYGHIQPFTVPINNKTRGLPYDIKISTSGKGFSFGYNSLPPDLRDIIIIYCMG